MGEPRPGDLFAPGQEVERSGIYKVIHDPYHDQEHEVTCIFGKRFPPCNGCGQHVRFTLIRGAQHIEHNKNFKS
jgi:hypothetical protein